MKRSQINRIIDESLAFCERMNFHLPSFAIWSPEDWATVGHEYDEIRDNMLGWDVIDFGLGKFEEIGCVLFTIRNGNRGGSGHALPLPLCQDGRYYQSSGRGLDGAGIQC